MEPEPGSGFHPDSATVRFHDFLARGETDSAARNIAAVQPPERLENIALITRLDADSVIAHGEHP